MDRSRALEVLAETWNDGPLIRLAEATLEATETPKEREVDARVRVKGRRVVGARVAVVIEA